MWLEFAIKSRKFCEKSFIFQNEDYEGQDNYKDNRQDKIFKCYFDGS